MVMGPKFEVVITGLHDFPSTNVAHEACQLPPGERERESMCDDGIEN